MQTYDQNNEHANCINATLRNRMTDEQKQLILGALDSLAVALAAHEHVWTVGERAIYEEAIRLLGK